MGLICKQVARCSTWRCSPACWTRYGQGHGCQPEPGAEQPGCWPEAAGAHTAQVSLHFYSYSFYPQFSHKLLSLFFFNRCLMNICRCANLYYAWKFIIICQNLRTSNPLSVQCFFLMQISCKETKNKYLMRDPTDCIFIYVSLVVHSESRLTFIYCKL